MIKSIIFDFDGTILDTETASYRAWMSIYKRYGLRMSLKDWGRFVGTTNKEDNPYTFIKNNVADFALSENEVRSEMRQIASATIHYDQILPGVKELIFYAQNKNLKLGIATSSLRETVFHHLEKLNLQSVFDVVTTRDDVTTVKPDPELYLKTIEALKVNKNEVVAIEDSPNGALAAKRAGIICIVVPNQITKGLRFPEVDFIFESLEELDVSLLD